MASKQPRKQAMSPAKADTGEANKSARNRQRTPRRRASQARSESAATQTNSATTQAAVAPEVASESIDLSKNTTLSPESQVAQSKPQSDSAELATATVPGADRPRASTKRAALISMLERPEGASVAEIGQRLGWLPHTVRAAITGLRHAGREVTRSKNTTGQSVYRLARPETVGRRRQRLGNTRPARRRSRASPSLTSASFVRSGAVYTKPMFPHISAASCCSERSRTECRRLLWATFARSRSANCARSQWS